MKNASGKKTVQYHDGDIKEEYKFKNMQKNNTKMARILVWFWLCRIVCWTIEAILNQHVLYMCRTLNNPTSPRISKYKNQTNMTAIFLNFLNLFWPFISPAWYWSVFFCRRHFSCLYFLFISRSDCFVLFYLFSFSCTAFKVFRGWPHDGQSPSRTRSSIFFLNSA